MSSARSISPDQARRSLAASLSIDDLLDGSPPTRAVADLARAALCALAQSHDGPHPVHVLSLLNVVRRQVEALWPELATVGSECVRAGIDALATLGEAVELAGGRWLPTPTRWVLLPATQRCLVLSGLPTKALMQSTQIRLDTSVLGRLADIESLPDGVLGDESRLQAFESWLRLPDANLERWKDTVLNAASREMKLAAEVTEFDVYLPERNHPVHHRRWSPAVRFDTAPRGIRLCRQRAPNNRYVYWLATLAMAERGVRCASETEIRTDRFRLMYALDAAAGTSTAFCLTREGDDRIVECPNWLPGPERRLLESLTMDAKQGSALAHRRRVPRGVEGCVVRQLESLGLKNQIVGKG